MVVIQLVLSVVCAVLGIGAFIYALVTAPPWGKALAVLMVVGFQLLFMSLRPKR